MSFRQIFDRIARIARAEMGSAQSRDYERELRRAEELIEESRRPRRSSVDHDVEPPDITQTPEYARACSVIGVSVQATRAEIASAYRERARQFHPDRVSHLSADEQRAALRRMQALNLAYEFLERHAAR